NPDGSLLITGNILADGKVYGNGKLLIAGGNITCVGCGCTGTAGTASLNCPGASVSPGLINPHDHMTFQGLPRAASIHDAPGDLRERYENRQDWRNSTPNYAGHTKVTNPGSASAESR